MFRATRTARLTSFAGGGLRPQAKKREIFAFASPMLIAVLACQGKFWASFLHTDRT